MGEKGTGPLSRTLHYTTVSCHCPACPGNPEPQALAFTALDHPRGASLAPDKPDDDPKTAKCRVMCPHPDAGPR